MDKIKIIILALTISLVSCKKEEPIKEETVNCFCGNVELQYIRYSGGSPIGYTYFSRNNCTNAVYKFETTKEYTKKEYCLNYQW